MAAATFHGTCLLVFSDHHALRTFYKKAPGLKSLVSFTLYPGFAALFFHRWAHYIDGKGWRLPARLLQWGAIILTGADINPASEIGESCVLLHTTGTIITGKVGHHALFTAAVKVGGDSSAKDIGAGPGLPVIGNYVVFGTSATVLGPRSIGDHAFICALSLVIRDVPAKAKVFGVPAKVIRDLGRARPGQVCEESHAR